MKLEGRYVKVKYHDHFAGTHVDTMDLPDIARHGVTNTAIGMVYKDSKKWLVLLTASSGETLVDIHGIFKPAIQKIVILKKVKS